MHVCVCVYVSLMYMWVYIIMWIYAYLYNHFYLSDWQTNILKIFSIKWWIEISTLIHFVRNVGLLVPSWEREGRKNLAISIKILIMHSLWPSHFTSWSQCTTQKWCQKYTKISEQIKMFLMYVYIHTHKHSHTHIFFVSIFINNKVRNSNKRWTTNCFYHGFCLPNEVKKLFVIVKGNIVWNSKMLLKIHASMRHLTNNNTSYIHMISCYKAIKETELNLKVEKWKHAKT